MKSIVRDKSPMSHFAWFLKAALPSLRLCAAITLVLVSMSGYAQTDNLVQVTGTVKSTSGEPVVGANVKVKGGARTTQTDVNGKYSFKVPAKATLVFTYVGFETEEIPLAAKVIVDVIMKESNSDLNEVIVVGYGTIKKSDFTGSASVVRLDNVNETKSTNVVEALQGKLAGVNIITNTGEPGGAVTFNIRGMTSVTGSNQPLIVIDGQPIESSFSAGYAGTGLDGGADIPPPDPLAGLNPNDIESVEVLKDATSTAIYGSRGANGVVLITTKTGKGKKDNIVISARYDLSRLPKKLDVLNSLEYMLSKNEAAANSGLVPVYSQQQLDSISLVQNTNWQDEVYRSALSKDYNVSVSSNDKISNYLLSGQFNDAQSVIKNSYFTKGGLRFNYNRDIGQKIKVGIRSYASYVKRRFGLQSNWTGILGSSVVMGALSFNPLQNAYIPLTEDVDETLVNNPVFLLDNVDDNTSIRTIITNFNFDYSIVKHLKYQFKAGINNIYTLRKVYYPTNTFIGNSAPGGSATQADNNNANYQFDHILTYNNNFKKTHNLNVVGGYSYQHWYATSYSITNLGFPSNTLGYDFPQGATFPGRTYATNRERALSSFLGRLNYSYKSKYLLTVTGRADGSSRLAEGHKWSFYPSVGLGWNISNENFMKKYEALSNLKLRASYGKAGNDNAPIYSSQNTYGINQYPIGQTIGSAYVTDQFANPNLGWEQSRQIDAGIDVGLFKDKLSFSLDFYDKKTTDLLINLPLAGSAGYSSYFTNVGEVNNRGIDFETSFHTNIGKVKLDLGGNISKNTNKVISMGDAGVVYGRGFFAGGAIVLGQPVTAAKVGYNTSSFWGYVTNGIYQNQDEINNDPALRNDGAKSTISPGMVKYVDINDDGQINDFDKTVIGDATPDFTYGFNGSASYKKFTMNFTIFGSKGGQLLNLNRWMVGSNHTNASYNSLRDAYEGRWRGEGTSNLYPKLRTEAVRLQQRLPNWMVEDASFIRLQNVTLSYSFTLPKKVGFSSLRAFVTGTNLLTITPYTGYDPNISSFGQTSLNNGLDLGTLPQARSYSLGLTLTY